MFIYDQKIGDSKYAVPTFGTFWSADIYIHILEQQVTMQVNNFVG